MTTDKYVTKNIRLSQEECSVLEEALTILNRINLEIDSDDADEFVLSDNLDKELLRNIQNQIDSLGCAIEFD